MKRDKQTINRISASTTLTRCLPIYRANGLQYEGTSSPMANDLSERLDVRRIVVPLDGSPQAEHALPHALAIARRNGASLRIMHVYSEAFASECQKWALAIAHRQHACRDYLDAIASRINRAHHLRVEVVLVDSPSTTEALAKGATGVALVVIASRRRPFASCLWWRNSVDQLRRRLSVPLLVAKGDSSFTDLRARPAISRIVLPLDGTVPTSTVIECASFVTRTHGGQISLLNVQNEDWTAGSFYDLGPRAYFMSTINRLRQVGIDAVADVLTSSQDPRLAIKSYVESHNIDLIAIPTRGDGGLDRLMRSSVADYLLRNTNLPVFLQSIPKPVKRAELTRVS